MPKVKTSSGAKKRFKVTGSGKLLRRQAMKSHNLEHKSPKRKRRFDKDQPVREGRRAAPEEAAGDGVTDAESQEIRSRAQETPQGARRGEGLLGPQEVELQVRKGAGRALARLRLSRPQEQEAHVPPALDRAHQRGRPGQRDVLQPVHLGPAQGRHRARPQGAGRSGRGRPGRLHGDRRAGQGGARVAPRRPDRIRRRRSSAGRRRTATGARRSTPTSAGGSPSDERVAGARRRADAGTRRCACSAGCTRSSSAAWPAGTTSTPRSSTRTAAARARARSRRTRCGARGCSCPASSRSLGRPAPGRST